MYSNNNNTHQQQQPPSHPYINPNNHKYSSTIRDELLQNQQQPISNNINTSNNVLITSHQPPIQQVAVTSAPLLPNISSFNYFHQEYATPLTSEFRSFPATSTSANQFLLSDPSQRATMTNAISNNVETQTTQPQQHTSSTDSSSSNNSSSQSSRSEKPLARHSRESLGTFYNDDSWQSNTNNENTNNSAVSAGGGLSSFDASFQQALNTQENLNEANRSKKLDVLSADEIRQYFCYTQQDAARLLGVSVSTLKRRFYELKLGKRWPYKRTKQTPRKRKDKQHISEERQLIDQGIRACSNVMILTPMKHSPIMMGNNNYSSPMNISNNNSGSIVASNTNGGREGQDGTTPPSSGNMSQQSTMIFEKKRSNLSSGSSNSVGAGIEKQHKMNTSSSIKVLSPIKHFSPLQMFPHPNNELNGSTNRSRSSSNLSMSSSSVSSSTNPNNNHHSSSNHSLQELNHPISVSNIIHHHPSSSINTRNENSCKRETSMEQSRKKLSLSFILNHSDNSSEQTS